MEWSYVRRSWDWTLREDSSLRWWSVTGTCSPGKWSRHQGCQTSRSVWTMLLVFGLILGTSESNRDLDSMILIGHFQLELFYDYMSLYKVTSFWYSNFQFSLNIIHIHGTIILERTSCLSSYCALHKKLKYPRGRRVRTISLLVFLCFEIRYSGE